MAGAAAAAGNATGAAAARLKVRAPVSRIMRRQSAEEDFADDPELLAELRAEGEEI
jgi:hypothetical protein